MTSRDRWTRALADLDSVVRTALRSSVEGQEPHASLRNALLSRAAAAREQALEGTQTPVDDERPTGYRQAPCLETYQGWNMQEASSGLDIMTWLLHDHLRKRLGLV